MKNKIRLQPLTIKEELNKNIPLFYHFISYNKLKPGNPFAYTEFSQKAQSLIFFGRPEKPVSKIIDVTLL